MTLQYLLPLVAYGCCLRVTIGLDDHTARILQSSTNINNNCTPLTIPPPLVDTFGNDRIVVGGVGGVVYDVVDDPRWIHVCPPEFGGISESSGWVKREGGVTVVEVPGETVEIVVLETVLRVSSSRSAVQLADPDDITHQTIQLSGPVDTQNNVVFLSSGYLFDQQDLFNQDVEQAVEFMKIPSLAAKGFGESVPFARYTSFLNIFSVFQPSLDEGGSRPATNTKLDNNLECTYGDPSRGSPERMLACSMELVNDLASTAPCGAQNKTNVVVVTFVNSNIYGGAGVYYTSHHGTVFRQASFFNGYLSRLDEPKTSERFASLFFHEIEHAYANLFDEYSYDINSHGDRPSVPNCATEPAYPPWQDWITLDSSDPYSTLSRDPLPICGYTDFYKPSDSCIMDSLLAGRFCPVCREAGVVAFYTAGQDLSNPRCPQGGEIVVLEPGEHIYLYANKRMAILGDFDVTWSVGNTILDNPDPKTAFKVVAESGNTTGYAVGVHQFKVEVVDRTSWVMDGNRLQGMKAEGIYTVNIVKTGERSTLQGVEERNCHSGEEGKLFDNSIDGRPHYSYCDGTSNLTCKLEYAASRYQSTTLFDQFASEVEGMIFGVVGMSLGGLLLIFLASWWFMTKDNAKRAKCIFKSDRPKYLEIIRWTMIYAAVGFMVLALVAVVSALIYYTQLGAIGKIFIFASLPVSTVLFVVAFVGFSGAWYRSRCALTINQVLLGFCVVLWGGWLVFAVVFHKTHEDEESWAQQWIEDIWLWLAEEYDAVLCSLQKALQCSGYMTSCHRMLSLKYCPENCEATHSKPWANTPCRTVLRDRFDEKFIAIIIISVFLVAVLLVGSVLNYILRKNLIRYNEKVRNSFVRRESEKAMDNYENGVVDVGELVRGLSEDEREKLKDEFSKVDGDGKGLLGRKEFQFFIKTALLYKVTDNEVEKIFSKSDEEHTGRISFDNFIERVEVETPKESDDVIEVNPRPTPQTAPLPLLIPPTPTLPPVPALWKSTIDIPLSDLAPTDSNPLLPRFDDTNSYNLTYVDDWKRNADMAPRPPTRDFVSPWLEHNPQDGTTQYWNRNTNVLSPSRRKVARRLMSPPKRRVSDPTVRRPLKRLPNESGEMDGSNGYNTRQLW